MGWWKDGRTGVLVGDEPLDQATDFLRQFAKVCREDLGRKPTLAELLCTLELALAVNTKLFEDLENKEVECLKAKTRPARKKKDVRTGDVFAVPLGGDKWGYGQMIWDSKNMGPLVQFFTLKTKGIAALKRILASAKGIYSYIVVEMAENGTWPIVGHVPVCIAEDQLPPFVLRETGKLKVGDSVVRKATKGELAVLPDSEIWSSGAVVDELRKALAGAAVVRG